MTLPLNHRAYVGAEARSLQGASAVGGSCESPPKHDSIDRSKW